MRFLFCFLFTKIPAFWRHDVESCSGGQRQPITLRLQLAFLGRFRIRAISQSSASFGLASWTAQKRSTSTNHASLAARVLGTFSHSSHFPIVCVLRTCLLDGSEAVNVSQSRFACSSRSWDVFAFEPFPNRLRPSDLPLGRLRIQYCSRFRSCGRPLRRAA